MFGIGLPELIIILIVALLVVGPKKLPELAKSVGKALHQVKTMTDDVKQSFEEITDEDFEESRKTHEPDKTEAAGEGDAEYPGTGGIGDPYMAEPVGDGELEVADRTAGGPDIIETTGAGETGMAEAAVEANATEEQTAQANGPGNEPQEPPDDPVTAAGSGGYGNLRG